MCGRLLDHMEHLTEDPAEAEAAAEEADEASYKPAIGDSDMGPVAKGARGQGGRSRALDYAPRKLPKLEFFFPQYKLSLPKYICFLIKYIF